MAPRVRARAVASPLWTCRPSRTATLVQSGQPSDGHCGAAVPPRLRDVVALPDLGLAVHAARGRGLDRPVRWVAVSELRGPGAVPRGRRAPAHDRDAAAADGSPPARRTSPGSSRPTSRPRARRWGWLRTRRCRPRSWRPPRAPGCRCSRCPSSTPFIAVTKAVSRAARRRGVRRGRPRLRRAARAHPRGAHLGRRRSGCRRGAAGQARRRLRARPRPGGRRGARVAGLVDAACRRPRPGGRAAAPPGTARLRSGVRR